MNPSPECNPTQIQPGSISLVEGSFKNLIESEFLRRRLDSKKHTSVGTFQTQEPGLAVLEFIRELFPDYISYDFSSTQTWLISPCDELIVQVQYRSASLCSVDITGDRKLVDQLIGKLSDEYPPIEVMISWIYSNDGGSFEIPLTPPKHAVTDAAYPYLEGGVEKFVDGFIASSENVLVLLGTPGTGKSTFLKYLLQRMQKSALVTYDTGILEKDYLFGEFMEGNHGSLVMEDADAFLEARSTGNTLMHKFLNVGDGLVSSAAKKIIFTTNLESQDNIDPALLRPGRCYAVVNFRQLTRDESKTFMKEYDDSFDLTGLTNTHYSLAELYNQVRNRTVTSTKTKFGFV